ncbi:MAG: M28 family peptidase [Myxococcota bacterium]
MVAMMGWLWEGPVARAPAGDVDVSLVDELRHDVRALAVPRNDAHRDGLRAATGYVRDVLAKAGLVVHAEPVAGEAANVVAEATGTLPMPLFGAHLDSFGDSPGADDNASGVAVMLAVARRWKARRPAHAARFVAFANEEPPHLFRATMGSLVHAHGAKARGDRLGTILVLQSVGARRAGSLTLVSDRASKDLARGLAERLRDGEVPIALAVLPRVRGPTFSDHWSFREVGWPAAMLTGAPPLRSPHPHGRADTPDALDYPRMARLVNALLGAIE